MATKNEARKQESNEDLPVTNDSAAVNDSPPRIDAPLSNPAQADASTLMVNDAADPNTVRDEQAALAAETNAPVITPTPTSSYVTLASSVDGMPRFQTVEPPTQEPR